MYPHTTAAAHPQRRWLYALLGLCLVAGGLFALARPAYANSLPVDGTHCTLFDAIIAANTDKVSGGCPAGQYTDTLTISTDITLTAHVMTETIMGTRVRHIVGLPAINSAMIIQGNIPTRTISGADQYRIFWVESGVVTFQNLTLQHGLAQGHNGMHGDKSGGGGGGLGAGGALLVNTGTVSVQDILFQNNRAVGGEGGEGGGYSGHRGNHSGYIGSHGGLGGFGGDFDGGGGLSPRGRGFGGGGDGSHGGSRATFAVVGFGGGGGGFGIGVGLEVADGSLGGFGGFGGAVGGFGSSGGFGGGGLGGGGAIFIMHGQVTVTKSHFTGNSASSSKDFLASEYRRGYGFGGAIFSYQGSLALTNNTFAHNVADAGAAIYLCGKSDTDAWKKIHARNSGGECSAQLTVNKDNIFGENTEYKACLTDSTCGSELYLKSFNTHPNEIDTNGQGLNAAGKVVELGKQKTEQRLALAATSAGAEVTASPADLTDMRGVAGGDEHSLALRSDGTVVAWGDNRFGQGVVPPALSGVTVTAIAAGAYHNLALHSDGTVVAWGDNRFGQGVVPPALSGVPVTAIAAGAYHNLALRSDGTVVAWGANDAGQRSVPAGLQDVTAIAAGAEHSLALRHDGTVVAWGDNRYGQRSLPAGLGHVVAIAAGQYHNLALQLGGTVAAWGRNDVGQSAPPAGLADVVAVAANYHHSLALRVDGTVVTWGGNYDGQRDLPANLGGIAAISAGGHHTLLIQAADSTPPTTRISSSEAYSSSTSAEFWLSGVDDITRPDGLAFQCQLDGGAWTACGSPQSYSNLAAGSHTVAVKAVDAAGNVSPTPATHTWTVNPPAPVLEVFGPFTTTQNLANLVSAAATTPPLLDFGIATSNRAITVRHFTLYNTGNADLALSNVAITGAQAGDFTISQAPPATLAPGVSAEVAVTFASSAAGLRTATLTVTHNDSSQGAYTLALQGVGTDVPYPTLAVPDAPIRVLNNRFSVPLQLTTNGATLSALGFALTYNADCLTFDGGDSDGDGVPNGLSGVPLSLAPSIRHSTAVISETVTYTDTTPPTTRIYTATVGTLEIALLDDVPPIIVLSDSALLTLAFGVAPSCVTTDGTLNYGAVTFATTPAVSFGNPQAADVAGAASGAYIPLQFNAAPTALALSNRLIDENSPAGVTVGNLSVTDQDSTDTHSYSLVAGEGDRDNSTFTLQGATLKTAIALNYEPRPEYFIRVRVTDNGGLFYEDTLIIQTGDLSEAPQGIVTTDGPASDSDPATLDLAENQPADTLVAHLDPSNPDTNNHYTYALVTGSGSTDNASFSVLDNQLHSAAAFNYEAKPSYAIRLRITDKQNRSAEQAFTVVINNVDEGLAAADDLLDPRTILFLGGQTAVIDVLANDSANGGGLTIAAVTQPAAGQGSVANNTTHVSYSAPPANGSTSFTYQATNGSATSNSAAVSLSYIANDTRGDCNGNGNVAAADFIGTVLEIFDTSNSKGGDNEPAWWLTYTGGYAGSPRGCDSNASGNPVLSNGHRQASITAADIICSVLLFFGHPCGGGVQAAGAMQAATLSVAAIHQDGQTTLPVTLTTNGHAVAAAVFALNLGAAAFDATDANRDGVPDAVTLTIPAGMNKSVTWNAAAQRLEVALYGASLPLPTLADGVLATVTVTTGAATVTPTLTLVSLSDTAGNDLLATPGTSLFLPLVTR